MYVIARLEFELAYYDSAFAIAPQAPTHQQGYLKFVVHLLNMETLKQLKAWIFCDSYGVKMITCAISYFFSSYLKKQQQLRMSTNKFNSQTATLAYGAEIRGAGGGSKQKKVELVD